MSHKKYHLLDYAKTSYILIVAAAKEKFFIGIDFILKSYKKISTCAEIKNFSYSTK